MKEGLSFKIVDHTGSLVRWHLSKGMKRVRTLAMCMSGGEGATSANTPDLEYAWPTWRLARRSEELWHGG